MPTPKSVSKITKDHGKVVVSYESAVDKCSYYLFELTRAALRDVGKFVAKTFKAKYYAAFRRQSGNVGRNTKYKVYSGKDTQYPRVELSTVDDGFYGLFQEIGTKHQPRMGFLRDSVENNVDTIREIESKYLSAIDDGDASVENLINESEYEGAAE